MASNGDGRPQRPGFMPPGFADLVVPPLKVGVYSGMLNYCYSPYINRHPPLTRFTGTAGVLAGVGGAIARDTNPVTSGALSGVQWFMLGSSYWCTFNLFMAVLHSHSCCPHIH